MARREIRTRVSICPKLRHDLDDDNFPPDYASGQLNPKVRPAVEIFVNKAARASCGRTSRRPQREAELVKQPWSSLFRDLRPGDCRYGRRRSCRAWRRTRSRRLPLHPMFAKGEPWRRRRARQPSTVGLARTVSSYNAGVLEKKTFSAASIRDRWRIGSNRVSSSMARAISEIAQSAARARSRQAGDFFRRGQNHARGRECPSFSTPAL